MTRRQAFLVEAVCMTILAVGHTVTWIKRRLP